VVVALASDWTDRIFVDCVVGVAFDGDDDGDEDDGVGGCDFPNIYGSMVCHFAIQTPLPHQNIHHTSDSQGGRHYHQVMQPSHHQLLSFFHTTYIHTHNSPALPLLQWTAL